MGPAEIRKAGFITNDEQTTKGRKRIGGGGGGGNGAQYPTMPLGLSLKK